MTYQKEIELIQKGYIITPALLKEATLDKVVALNEKTLLEVLDEHNSEQKAMIGKTVAPATYWTFEYSERLLKEFILNKYERQDLYLREINMNFIQGFHAFLLSEKNMSQNSTTKHLKFLKKLLNYAVANSYITNNTVNSIALGDVGYKLFYYNLSNIKETDYSASKFNISSILHSSAWAIL